MRTKTPLPIITVFRGDRYYLPHCIAQARVSNPDSAFILLGDNSTKYYRGISHYNYKDYYQSAQKLEDIYTHIHTSADRFLEERFCFLRWFILNDFMKKQGLEQCFVIDADALIYDDLKKIRPLYDSCELTLGGRPPYECMVGSSSFVFKRSILDQLADIIVEIYSQTPLNITLSQSVKSGEKKGISDMIALAILYQRFPEKIKNTFFPCQGHLIQYSTTETQQGVEMQEGAQKIYWINNRPHGQWLESSAKIKFAVVHCQGSQSKKKMWRYVRLPRFSDKSFWWLNILQYKLYKYPKRFLNKLLGKKLFPKL